MGAKAKEYDVNFVCRNFNASDIQPRKIWGEIKDDYVAIHRDYEKLLNESVAKLNELWKTMNPHKEGEEYDEDDEAVRYSWYMHDSLNTLAYLVGQDHPDSYLSPFVFYGDEGPQFACRIVQHPTLWMTHVKKTK